MKFFQEIISSKKFRIGPFFIVPIITIILFIQLDSARGNYFFGTNFDPEYVYLLNSLEISEFKTPFHIDHPGTSLQIIGGIIIKILNVGKTSHDTQINVLTYPEFFIFSINIFLILLTTFFLLLLGIFTYTVTRNIWMGIFLQLSIFFSINIYMEIIRVRPDHLLIPITIFLIILLLSLLKNNLSEKRNFYITAFSLVMGLGMATKITFLPLLLIPFIILKGLKNKLSYIIGTIFFFAIFTLPIAKHYGRFFTWIQNIFIHSEHYGSGSATIINPSEYFNNIFLGLYENSIFSIVLFCSIIFLFSYKIYIKHSSLSMFPIEYTILFAVTLAQIMQVFFVAKHYNSHYLIPALMLTGTAAFFLFLNTQKIYPISFRKKHMLFGVCIILFSLYSINNFKSLYHSLEKNKNEQLAIVHVIETSFKDFTKIYYYRSSSPAYALKFGNDFSGNEYKDSLNQLYPKNYFYNIWNNLYYDFGDVIDEKTFTGNILYQGTSFEKEYKQNTSYKPNASLKDVYQGEKETIYLKEL